MLVDFPFQPGLFSNTTDRGVGKIPQWKNGNRVRFHNGFPQTIGGWVQEPGVGTLTGVARAAIDWQTLRLQDLIAIGTNSRLYVIEEAAKSNITPIAATGTLTDPFTTTNGSTTVTVTSSAHGLTVGTYVDFSGASPVGGLTIDGEYSVATVVDGDNYTIVAASAATSDASGGGSVGYEYGINAGYVNAVTLRGFGISAYGLEEYGDARTTGDVKATQLWSFDTWGEDLIACFRDGNIYLWDSSGGTVAHATLLASAPTNCKAAFVSQEDRHLVALGADGDPMYIRWCSQEDYTDWLPAVDNTAGDKRLDQGNQIFCAVKLRAEHLIMTDAAAYSMQFIGPPFTFGFKPMGSNFGLLGPNAIKEFEGKAYWMGMRGFFMYDGVTTRVECDVLDYVFDDINLYERFKFHAHLNYRYNEIWWFYVSAGSTEIDRYVAYNPKDNTWVFGELARTVMVADSDIIETPYAVSPEGVFYYHETGVNDDAAPLGAFLESGDIEVAVKDDASGNYIGHVSKFVPDFQRLSGDVHVTFTGKKYPAATETQSSGPHAMDATTEYLNPRMRCRQIYIRLETVDVNGSWRLGLVRFDIIPHGKR